MTFLGALILLLSFARIGNAAPALCEKSIISVIDVLNCADSLSPEVRRASLDLEQARLQVGAASQWRNPEVSVTSFSGSVSGSRQSETDVLLGVPLELGGKIAARRAVGQAGVAQAEAAVFSTRATVRKNTIVNLHRLRQLHHELTIVDESIAAFSTLVKQYGSRARRSPEQEASGTVYRIAKSQYELKKADLNDELSQLNSYFLLTVGKSEAELRSVAPPSPAEWPVAEAEVGVSESPRLKAAKADLDLAEANLRLAKSEAWPTLSIGPSLRMQNQGGTSGSLLGFNLGLPIPLFNANGAGRAAAAAGVALSDASRELAKRGEVANREQLTQVYRRSLALLSSTLSHTEIERAHHSVEGLFTRGVVPSALVIEAHRSYLDLEVARNERERKTMEALLAIYEINGTILEKNL